MAKYTPFSDNAALTEFGKRIAGARLNNNWTQADLANKAGVSKSTVEHIEKGQSTQLLNMIKILRALGHLNQFISIVPELGPSPMELLAASRKQLSSKRKRASKPRTQGKTSATTPRNKTQGKARALYDPGEFSTTSIAAESKAKWVWDEDK